MSQFSFLSYNFVYSLLIALIFSSAYGDWSIDYNEYINYANNAQSNLYQSLEHGGLTFIFDEPFWLFVNFSLNNFFDPNEVVLIFVFLNSFIYSNYILHSTKNNFIRFFFIFSPFFFIGFAEALRQGFGLGLLIVSLRFYKFKYKFIFMILACFTHNLFWLISGVMIFFMFLSKINKKDFEFLLFLLPFFIILLIYVSLSIIPFRQSDYYLGVYESSGSGLGFLFWCIILGLYIYACNFKFKIDLKFFWVLFYISSYFFLPFSGRIFQSTSIFYINLFEKIYDRFRFFLILTMTLFFILNWWVYIEIRT